MKHKIIETGQDILIILMNHLVLIGFSMTVMGMFKQKEHYMWLWCVLTAVPLIFYFSRAVIGDFFLFFALHLLIPAAMFFLPIWILPKVLVVGMVIAYMVWSINIRLKGRKKGEDVFAPMFAIAALGVMTLIENAFSKMGWEAIYLWLAIFYIAGYFIYSFTNQYLRFLTVNESSAANIPEREIFSSGMRQTVLFVAGGVLVLFMTANIGWVSYIMSWIGKALLAVLRTIFAWISYEETEELEPYVTEKVQGDMGMFAEKGEPALIWLILEKLIMVAAAVFLVGGVILGIVMGIRYLWKHFHMTSLKEEKKLQTGIDIRETCTIEKNKKETNRWFSLLNPQEKIRKIYRKQVLKHKSQIIGDYNPENLEHMTAKECCNKMISDNKFSPDNLKMVYEKARYSAEEITPEDLKLVKTKF